MAITHTFVSAVADSGDAGEVSSSEWNDSHTITTSPVAPAIDDKILFKDTSNSDVLAHTTPNALGWLRVVKAAPESRNTTTTLADDGELTFPVTANTLYAFRMWIFGATDATPDFKFAIAAPAVSGSRPIYTQRSDSAAVTRTGFANLAGMGTQTILVSGFTRFFVEIGGQLAIGASGGTVAFQWAQNTSNATDASVYEGSFIEYFQL